MYISKLYRAKRKLMKSPQNHYLNTGQTIKKKTGEDKNHLYDASKDLWLNSLKGALLRFFKSSL